MMMMMMRMVYTRSKFLLFAKAVLRCREKIASEQNRLCYPHFKRISSMKSIYGALCTEHSTQIGHLYLGDLDQKLVHSICLKLTVPTNRILYHLYCHLLNNQYHAAVEEKTNRIHRTLESLL